jgi:3-oxoadipate enol-lactonase
LNFMPTIELPAGRFLYRFDGPEDAPLLVFSNSLGTDHTMWDKQVLAFTHHFRVLRYDTRGHGASAAPAGTYTMAELGQDVLDLFDRLDIARAHFCGLSMGGMTGIWLAANAPQRVDRLALCNTAALMGPPENWDTRIAAIRAGGMSAIADAVIARWFSAPFLNQDPHIIGAMRDRFEHMSADGYIACCEAIRDMDQRTLLGRIANPTLVIAGELDQAATSADGRFLADAIPNARYVELTAAHLSNIEAPQAFNTAALDFFTGDPTNA